MNAERKQQLVATIKATHPTLRVSTSWSMCDWDHSGIEIHAQHAATGNTLCASRDDAALDGMSDADVMAWVNGAVADFQGRQKRTRRAMAVEREMERE